MADDPQVAALVARVDALERELADLKGDPAGEATRPAPAAPATVSRRSLLRRLGGAAAAGAGLAAGAGALGARPASAHDAQDVLLGANTTTVQTSITSSSSTATFTATNTSTGRGVEAKVNNASSGASALFALTDGTGNALQALVTNTDTDDYAAYVQTAGMGPAIGGVVNNTANVRAAIQGDHLGFGPAVRGTSVGYGLEGQGGLAPLYLHPAAASGPPTTGSHLVGEVYVDATGALFTCTAAGAQGTWVRVGFNPITPFRLVDTRQVGGPIGPGVANERAFTVSPSGTAPNGVPANVSAACLNVTVVDATAASYVTVFPSDFTFSDPDAPYSSVNFTPGQVQANQVSVKLGPDGKVKVFNRAGTVNVIIDVMGFFS